MTEREDVVSLLLGELQQAARDIDARRTVWDGCASLLPSFTFPGLRTQLLRYAGPDIAPGVAIMGRINFVGPRGSLSNLQVGPNSLIAPNVTLCLDATITIGAGVSVGPGACLYTGTHDLGTGSRRMALKAVARPIVVEDGAWIGMNAVVLAGVRIGRGAVVAAGAVVSADVLPNTLVVGNPAVVTQKLPFGER